MGFIKKWNMQDVQQQIHRCYAQVVSHYNDGYTQWDCKKELLELKFELDELLKNTPHFSHEEDNFLAEQEKKKIVKILKS
jgi:hypothetical protein